MILTFEVGYLGPYKVGEKITAHRWPVVILWASTDVTDDAIEMRGLIWSDVTQIFRDGAWVPVDHVEEDPIYCESGLLQEVR